MAAGTLLSTTRWHHWFVRGWDFPRLQIAGLAALAGASYLPFWQGGLLDGLFLAMVLGTVAWQVYRIGPYLPVAPTTVRWADDPEPEDRLDVVTSNVQMENDRHDRWLDVVRRDDPDMILALEVGDRWMEAIEELEDAYPYAVKQPQENYYGMALYSRLELVDPQVRYLVQDDVPSIHTEVRLPSGRSLYFHCVHPRPPEPIRDQDSAPRDAEVVILAREIRENRELPTVVVGDFNDVAWSRTTELFREISGLLDPRRGRGLYNTFHARHWYFRFPLDHVFHSNDFRLVRLERLDSVGSDHFPIRAALAAQPLAPVEQEEPEADGDAQEEADQMVEVAAEQEETDVDPGDAKDPDIGKAPGHQADPTS